MPQSNTILYRMPFGIPGDISRPSQATVEAQPFNSSLPFLSYGIPGKIAGGLFVPLALVGDTTPYGFLVRPFPTTGATASDPLGGGVPLASALLANVLRRGYISALCNAGVPGIGGAVYVRYANPSGALVVGGLEATFVSGSNVALTNCQFMGPSDSAGNCEIGFNI